MAGYNYKRNMSNNAVDAYAMGAKPYNEWSFTDIFNEILDDYDPENHCFDINKLANVSLEVLKMCFLSYSSWHHTTKQYKETEFYFVDKKKMLTLTDEDIDKYIDYASRDNI